MWNIFKKKQQGKELIFTIEGMHCTSCAMNIDGALEDTEGVFSSETSYAKSQVKIHFDPEKLTETELQKIIANQGYKASNS